MKGLLLKDYYTLFKQARIFILLILVFAVLPGDSMTGFAVVYAAMLPITALAYDERAKWDSLAAMMPYSVRNIVFSKYLLGYIGIIAAGILASAAKLANSIVQHTAADPETYPSILIIACVAAFVLALNLPIMFKFGVERGRIAFFVAIAVAAVGAAAVGKEAMSALSAFKVDLITILLVSVIATLAINIISVLLSFRFYKRRIVS